MGSDDLHKRRKIRHQEELQRRRANRQLYNKMLIVCEGEKTERYYFESIKKHCRPKAVSVLHKCGSDPLSVAKAAEKQMKIAKREGDPYDKVYCVFDKDGHSTYDEAVDRLKRNPKIDAVVTVPCFEFWFLLHFEDTAQPFRDCSQVIQLLKKHIPDYRKGKKDLFDNDLLFFKFSACFFLQSSFLKNLRNMGRVADGFNLETHAVSPEPNGRESLWAAAGCQAFLNTWA